MNRYLLLCSFLKIEYHVSARCQIQMEGFSLASYLHLLSPTPRILAVKNTPWQIRLVCNCMFAAFLSHRAEHGA